MKLFLFLALILSLGLAVPVEVPRNKSATATSHQPHANHLSVNTTLADATFTGNLGKAYSSSDRKKLTDILLFDTKMQDFQRRRKAHDPKDLNWGTHTCNPSAGRFPLTHWNFLDSCQRYDFGCLNYKDQHRYTKNNKKRIDKKFHKDLKEECKHHTISYLICLAAARVYYQGVKTFGYEPNNSDTDGGRLVRL